MSGWKGLLRVVDGTAPQTLELKASAVQRAPDMQDLADDVERTRYELECATAAHDHALKAWRDAKAERGLE